MRFLSFLLFITTMTHQSYSQDDTLPYKDIIETPESYTAGSVVSRMLDGLGFRYYWATEGLREEDLAFRPNKTARTSGETINHILGLSQVIVNCALEVPNGNPQPEMIFEEKRKKTLMNIKKASEIFLKSKDISKFKIVFKRGDNTTEFPFWNQINGPISDAIWHVGQIVSFRRSSGNPFPKGVSVLQGVRRN